MIVAGEPDRNISILKSQGAIALVMKNGEITKTAAGVNDKSWAYTQKTGSLKWIRKVEC